MGRKWWKMKVGVRIITVRVVIQEAHLLHLSTHVFFARCIDWVVEWDDSVVQSSLIVSRVHIHVVDIEGVLHEAFMCR